MTGQQLSQPAGNEVQAEPAAPPRVHALPWLSVGQLMVPHAGLLAHVTSHAHAALHVTLLHALAVVQLTSQGPALHVTAPHAPLAVHRIVHPIVESHVTEMHAPGWVHSTLHGASVGQATLPARAPSITQVGGVVE